MVLGRSTRSLDSTLAPVNLIAERELICVKPSGERTSVILRIGQPYQSSPGEWACPVAAVGVQDRLPDIRGVDSFQSLALAQALLKSVLLNVEANGCTFATSDDDTPINVARMFEGAV